MTKKKLNKFEKNQLYKMLSKPEKMVEIANKYRVSLIINETDAEKEFRKILNTLKIRHDDQRIIYAGKAFYIIDFFLPKYNIGIELDGFHHTTEEGKKNDTKRTKELKKAGVKEIYRFMNDEVSDRIECINKIKSITNK